MNKIIKFFCIAICIFLTICQLNTKVYGYTLNEVKEMIDFTLYDGDKEPEDYDIKIDASELLSNEKLPCIVTSIEKILYSNDGIFDINFLGESTNTDENSSKKENKNDEVSDVEKKSSEGAKWLRNAVRTIFKVSLYISAACMLTLLIYMSVVTVSKGISEKSTFLPLSKIFKDTSKKGEEKPIQKSLQARRLVEQWISSVLLLVLLPYLINLMVAFSNYISSLGDNKKVQEDSITVYVKNSVIPQKESNSSSTIVDSALSSGIEELISSSSAGGNWSVYAKNLKTSSNSVLYNTNKAMPSASVIKLFIAATAYDRATNGLGYTVNESDMSSMITVSSNSAANNIIRSLGGYDAVNQYASKNGYSNTSLNRDFGITVFSKDNYTCANDVGNLLEKIYSNSIPGATNILNYMKEQTVRGKIPQGVESGVTVANKTGELGSNYPNGPVENDAAIVYKNDANYILVILSSNLKDDTAAINTIRDISKRVYNSIDSSIAGGTASSNSISIVDTAANHSLRNQVVEIARNQDSLGITQTAYCEGWVEEVYRKVLGKDKNGIPGQCCAHHAAEKSIVSNKKDDIIPGAAVFSFQASGTTTCGGVSAGHVGIYIGDGKIASYVGSGTVSICTINEWEQSWQFSGWGWLPGTEELATGGSSDGGQTNNTTINYTFKTNPEGLMMFQSQYNWGMAGKNFSNMIGGIAIAIFKYVLLGLYIVRAIILAMITAISPVIILVNAFKKITGSKGYLTKWLKLYWYLLLVRPAISLAYYVLCQQNMAIVSERPIYIVIVIVGIMMALVKSIKYLIKDLNSQHKKNAASRKVST